jgi:hypothetical protein
MDPRAAVRMLPLAAVALLLSGCGQASSVGVGTAATPSVPPSSRSQTAPSAAAPSTPSPVVPSPNAPPSTEPTTASPAPPGTPTASVAVGGGRVSGLVGRWAVHAKGEPASTRLILDGKSALSVYRDCGVIDGNWRADSGGAFINSLFGGSQACFASHQTDFSSLPWLWKAHGFRTVAGGWSLLDANGLELARLTPGSKPEVPPTILSSEADAPSLSPTDRAKLDRPPAALPAGLTATTTTTLAGTWVPVDASRGYLTLHPLGDWRGSDGCNNTSGSWAVLDGGAVLATSGPTTLVGCSGTDVGFKLIAASAAGFHGTELDLVGPDGQVSLRLQRGTAPATS